MLPGPPTPSRRDTDHHREVQQLYEEMEQQIQREKQQLQAEVSPQPQPASPPALDPSAARAVSPGLASVGQWEAAASGSPCGRDSLLRQMGWEALTTASSQESPGATPSILWVAVSLLHGPGKLS